MSELTAADRAVLRFAFAHYHPDHDEGSRAYEVVECIVAEKVAEQREQIAAELEAEATRLRHNTPSNRSVLTMRRAARLVRGAPR